MRRAHRRKITERTEHIHSTLRAAALRQPAAIGSAFAVITASEVRVISTLAGEIDVLGAVVAEHFGRHRDAEIYTSQPGLGPTLGARLLGEFGDAPNRYPDPAPDTRARRNYAGTSPITKASGTKPVVLARYARNRRLSDTVRQWALGSLPGSAGARTYYHALRARKFGHEAALRQLGNRLVGILHGRLKTGPHYDETTAWGHWNSAAA